MLKLIKWQWTVYHIYKSAIIISVGFTIMQVVLGFPSIHCPQKAIGLSTHEATVHPLCSYILVYFLHPLWCQMSRSPPGRVQSCTGSCVGSVVAPQAQHMHMLSLWPSTYPRAYQHHPKWKQSSVYNPSTTSTDNMNSSSNRVYPFSVIKCSE